VSINSEFTGSYKKCNFQKVSEAGGDLKSRFMSLVHLWYLFELVWTKFSNILTPKTRRMLHWYRNMQSPPLKKVGRYGLSEFTSDGKPAYIGLNFCW